MISFYYFCGTAFPSSHLLFKVSIVMIINEYVHLFAADPASSWWDDYQTTGKRMSSPQDLYQPILILG